MNKPRIRVEIGDLIVETFSVVLAILLALAVNNWQEHLRAQRQLRENVATIVRELEVNQKAIARLGKVHEREAAAIDRQVSALRAHGERFSYDQFSSFFAKVAPHGLGGLAVQDVAWKVAQTDQSLEQMPESDRIALASAYEEQRQLQAFYDRMIANIESYSDENRFALMANVNLEFGDVVAAEHDLTRAYATLIPRLKTSYHLQ